MPLFGGSKYVRGGAGQVSAGPGLPTIIGGGSGISTGGGSPQQVLSYVSLDGSVATAGDATPAWFDWDLSATLPAGTAAVDVLIDMAGTTTFDVGIRPNGSSLERRFTATMTESLLTMRCEVASDQIIEVYRQSAGTVSFKLIGYWVLE